MTKNSLKMNRLELNIVISAFNEERYVESVLNGVLAWLDQLDMDCEIIFLNNHSTDRTGPIADEIASRDTRLHVIHRENRISKDLGSSLREGLASINGKYVLIMDCDSSHEYQELNKLFSIRGDNDIVIGSRFVQGGKAELNLLRNIFSRSYNLFTRFILGVRVRDLTTGFKLYNHKIFEGMTLTNDGFGLHVEILLKALSKGIKVQEIPISYKKSGKSHLSYRKQFKSYMKPVVGMFKARIMGKQYV